MARTGDNPEGVPPETFDQMTNGMLEDRAKFMAHFLKDFYGVGLLTAPVSDEQLKLSWNHTMQAGLLPTLAAAKAFATTDFRGDLASFTMPTLVIHGTGDKTVPIEATGAPLPAPCRTPCWWNIRARRTASLPPRPNG
jgi:pimeloyl-ACP methyl ester carboxylesterase